MTTQYNKEYFQERDLLTHEVLEEANFALKFIKPYKVLDVGCGVGRHGYILEYYGLDVTYLDVSEYALDRIWWTDNKILMDISQEFPEGRWDSIVSFHLLEHIPLQRVMSVLNWAKYNADVSVFVVPDPKRTDYKDDPTHITHFTEPLLKTIRDSLDAKIYKFDNKWSSGIVRRLLAVGEALANKNNNIGIVLGDVDE